jgi:hypothetical protein
MNSSEAARAAVSIVASYFDKLSRGVAISGKQHREAESVIDAIRIALESKQGSDSALNSFEDNPRDGDVRSRLVGLLESVVEQDGNLRAELLESVSQADIESGRVTDAISGAAGRDSGKSVGGNNVENSRAGRDIVGGNKTNKVNLGAVAVIIGIVIGLVFAGKFVVSKVGELVSTSMPTSITKDSSCRDYLSLPPSDRDMAIKRVGLQLGIQSVGSPFIMPNVDYECGGSPDEKFGAILSRQNY